MLLTSFLLQAAAWDSLISAAFSQGLVFPPEEREALLQRITSLEAEVLREKEKCKDLDSSYDIVIGEWREAKAESDRKLLAAEEELCHADSFLQESEAKVQDLTVALEQERLQRQQKERELQDRSQTIQGQSDQIASLEDQLRRRDAQIADLQQRLEASEARGSKASTLEQRMLKMEAEMEALKKKSEEEVSALQAQLASARLMQQDERDDLYTVCLHKFRLAAFHALPDFEWAPVREQLLLNPESHPKEDKVLEEEAESSEDEP